MSGHLDGANTIDWIARIRAEAEAAIAAAGDRRALEAALERRSRQLAARELERRLA
jgi:hypothetical protein